MVAAEAAGDQTRAKAICRLQIPLNKFPTTALRRQINYVGCFWFDCFAMVPLPVRFPVQGALPLQFRALMVVGFGLADAGLRTHPHHG